MLHSRRLRIATINTSFNDEGSLQTYYARNAERLSEDEDVVAVCRASDRRATSSPIRFVTVEPLLPGVGRLRSAVACGSFALRASRTLDRMRPELDLVHVESFAALGADVVTVHAVRPAEIEHYWTRVHPARLPRRVLARVGRPLLTVEAVIARKLFSRTNPPLCIAISHSVASQLAHVYGLPPELIEVNHYPVDVDRFTFDPRARASVRGRENVPDDRQVVILIGDDLARKGLSRAIVGLACARRLDVELWVVGGTGLGRFADEARRAGVGDRVKLFGRLPPAVVPAYLSAADVFLLPSEHDVWGISVIEALAAGRPVVVSEYTGAHEVIRDGQTGFVLRANGTPDAIAALIDGPLASRSRVAVIGARGPAVARAYGFETVYQRFRSLCHRAHEIRQVRIGEDRSAARPPH